jgi:PBSX family phage terminase large subunit
VIVNFESTPLPIHEAFHRSTSYERMNFGAFGSGKTYAVVDEAIAWCLEQPGIRGLVARKTIPELRDTTEPIFRERLPAELWRAGEERRTGGHMESFSFPNGSQVLFRSLDDWNKHRSLNVGFIAYDEANEIDEETYMGMSSRVRQRDLTAEARRRGYSGQITRRGIWGATNPSGKDWLYRRFHPDSSDRAPNAAAFMSTTLDNPYLPPEYVESLLLYPKPWVQRYVLCQFDDFAGRIYEEWGWDSHTIEHPDWDAIGLQRPIVWMGMDPGTESPTAGLWVWIDQENRRLVGIAEYEDANVTADVHAAEWRRIENQQRMLVRWRVADPNAVTQRSRETLISLDTAYSKLGFNFSMGASSENARIPALAHLIHTRRFVVSRQKCPRTFEALKQYQWKDLTPTQRASGEDPTEKPLKKNTHLVECAQYIAGREAPMPKLTKSLNANSFQDEIHRTINKNLKVKYRRASSPRHDLGGLSV